MELLGVRLEKRAAGVRFCCWNLVSAIHYMDIIIKYMYYETKCYYVTQPAVKVECKLSHGLCWPMKQTDLRPWGLSYQAMPTCLNWVWLKPLSREGCMWVFLDLCLADSSCGWVYCNYCWVAGVCIFDDAYVWYGQNHCSADPVTEITIRHWYKILMESPGEKYWWLEKVKISTGNC